jgi:hypothetical protein
VRRLIVGALLPIIADSIRARAFFDLVMTLSPVELLDARLGITSFDANPDRGIG